MAEKDRILDYSAWISRSRSFPKGVKGLLLEESKKPLVQHEGWCPFCKRETDTSILMEQRSSEYNGHPEPEDQLTAPGTSFYELTVWECFTCGWWDIALEHIEDTETEGDQVNKLSIRAVLREYDPTDVTLPVETLRLELLRKQNTIHTIHDKKMEELVGSVLSDFFPGCEVHLCGRSGDGGIDLIVMITDTPFAVQVKRRMKPHSVEPVEPIRAFLGASLLRGFDHLLYVTSADHFTGGPYGAQTEAERAVERKLVQQFHLIDRHSFYEMLKLRTDKQPRYWTSLLPKVYADVGELLRKGRHLGI